MPETMRPSAPAVGPIPDIRDLVPPLPGYLVAESDHTISVRVGEGTWTFDRADVLRLDDHSGGADHPVRVWVRPGATADFTQRRRIDLTDRPMTLPHRPPAFACGTNGLGTEGSATHGNDVLGTEGSATHGNDVLGTEGSAARSNHVLGTGDSTAHGNHVLGTGDSAARGRGDDGLQRLADEWARALRLPARPGVGGATATFCQTMTCARSDDGTACDSLD
ncbi:hypothetical protein [Nocardia wallacei]|uniref:hypothetical protein n=1 Tax=Nocardia wallacei TaxID=480035 RepID=UPI0024537BD4|nr:hypothetical protein [Nocardia wallacei]